MGGRLNLLGRRKMLSDAATSFSELVSLLKSCRKATPHFALHAYVFEIVQLPREVA